MTKWLAIFSAVSGLAVGCATLQSAPNLAFSEAAVRAAKQAGAAELAPAELELATQKLALAKRWMAARDYEPASWLVEQARIDAELATLKAISAKAARKASIEVQELRTRNRAAGNASNHGS
jgi:hypothetical protein